MSLAYDVSKQFLPYFSQELKHAVKNPKLSHDPNLFDFKVDTEKPKPKRIQRMQVNFKARFFCEFCNG